MTNNNNESRLVWVYKNYRTGTAMQFENEWQHAENDSYIQFVGMMTPDEATTYCLRHNHELVRNSATGYLPAYPERKSFDASLSLFELYDKGAESVDIETDESQEDD